MELKLVKRYNYNIISEKDLLIKMCNNVIFLVVATSTRVTVVKGRATDGV